MIGAPWTVGSETREECKTVFTIPIAATLARWAALSGSARYTHISGLVWARATGSKQT